MPAPALRGDRGPITITFVDPATDAAVALRGFRINATLTSSSAQSDWSISINTQLVDPAVVDANDQSFSASRSMTLPLNEFPTQADVEAKVQELVDEVFDSIPSPAAP